MNYICRTESVTLGGTGQYNDWNTEVDENDKQRILDDCCKLVPSLRVNITIVNYKLSLLLICCMIL